MTMPRPSGRARQIADQVIPGLRSTKKSSSNSKKKPVEVLSEVEIIQTNNIENKKGLK